MLEMSKRNLAITVVNNKEYPYAWTTDKEGNTVLLFYDQDKRVLLNKEALSKYPVDEQSLIFIGKNKEKRGFGIYNKRYASFIIKNYLMK
jgi:hypothetical protein